MRLTLYFSVFITTCQNDGSAMNFLNHFKPTHALPNMRFCRYTAGVASILPSAGLL